MVDFAGPIICNRLASVAGPRGSGWVQATKEIVIKRLLPLPCTALHCPIHYDAARGRVAAHCPTVNNALGSLVSGGVATREARLTPKICQKKYSGEIFGKLGRPALAKEIQDCL